MIHRGDLYYVIINAEHRGHILNKKRPVLIISNEYNNCFANTVNVIPITSSTSSARMPTHIPISGFGLDHQSYAVCEQIMTVDKKLITGNNYIGTVDDENLLQRIVNGIIEQIGGEPLCHITQSKKNSS